ncbi:hypothetical protein M409DRAFT_53082 [Zasmidium cellare ATCC 36951]|uniref:Uncharacterized protein n=1 Tax=Zasmidium cellare ATCC 36951 TaxID=1080233 RepID=A0A6A6CP06_ZASCE|nr:uncharacterized protein M409DRAFT_53082 [Zasmidium cellare ATCC 36951]KAF2168393.1 hypothetical protein M409DRAFT_53082 [Zasmidium cellare ATCC 36951]
MGASLRRSCAYMRSHGTWNQPMAPRRWFTNTCTLSPNLLTVLQLRKTQKMKPIKRKGFLSRLAEKLDVHPNRDPRYNNETTFQQPKPSHNPETVLKVVTDAGPAELDARRAAIIAGRVIESNEYTLEPGQRGVELPTSHSFPNNTNNRPPIERRDTPHADDANARRLRKASATSIRELRWLIRAKYRLDVYVWSKRGVQKAMRPYILAEAKKSDALLLTILAIVKTWDRDLFSAEEWRLAKKIKENLIKSESQYVLWKDSPPWDPKRSEAEEEVDDEA